MSTAAGPRLSSLIGGAWTTSAGDDWRASLNPSDTNDVVAYGPRGVADDATAAVQAAADALPAWRGLSGPARAEHLYRWAGAIAERQEALAQMVAREVGKPIAEARGEAARCVAILRFYAG